LINTKHLSHIESTLTLIVVNGTLDGNEIDVISSIDFEYLVFNCVVKCNNIR